MKEAGQAKGQEQALEERDKPAICCQRSSKAVRKKRDSERDSEEETEGEEHDYEHIENNFDMLVEAIKKLVRLFSLEDVKKALVVAESDI